MAGLSIALAVVLANRFVDGRKRVDAVSAELRQLNAEWATASARLAEARNAEAWFDAFAEHAVRIENERDLPRWAPALRSVVACAGAGIQLREVRARRESGDAATWALNVGGVSTGAAPRTVADQFRLALQRELQRWSSGAVTTRFERIEELPDSASPGASRRSEAFAIMAKISFVEPPEAAIEKGG
jgi:hypothetical protein